ncbi:MAG: hypothetical protein HFG30_04040 [Eubacterium sp.]|nr:hypothetical protein [Eubacterium sp.]
MKKYFYQRTKQILSVLLALAIIASNFNVQVNARQEQTNVETKNINTDNEGKTEPVAIKELKNERTVDSNTYLLNNGMKKTVYYSDNIRYEEDGKVKAYNPELVKMDESDKEEAGKSKVISDSNAEAYKYVNKAGDTKQYLPKTMKEETPVLLTNNKYRVSFAPVSDKKMQEDTIFENKTKAVEIENQEVTNIVTEKEEEKKVKANYEYANEDVALSYQSLEHGIKEDIILESVPDTNTFSFVMSVENMMARLDDVGGGITFIDEDKDNIIGGIPAPVMHDAGDKGYSEEAYYELEQLESKKKNVNKYILKIVVDEKYLTSSERVYPVTIDPSVTWNGTGDLPDVYVLKSSGGTNYFSSGVKTFSVGKGSQGLFRSYIRAMELTNRVTNKYVESAKLTIYENGANTKGAKIQIRPALADFKCKTVTWNNQPGGTSAVLASFTASGTSGAKKVIDLTSWARNVAKGSGDGNKNYGLLFRLENESASSYVKFYGARSTDTAKVPKLAVTYYDGPTTASSVSGVSSADAGRIYLRAGESLKVNWAGISSQALSYVQYRIENASGTDVVNYSDSTKLGTTASGTKTISVASLDEGQYKIYVRGVDKGGIKGTGKAATFYIDKTAPEIMSLSLDLGYGNGQYSDVEPEITWNVKETYLSCVQVSINNGAYRTIGTQNNDSGDITGLESGKVNLIHVRAVDKAGNISSYSGYQYAYDCDAPVIKMSVNPDTDENKYDGSSEKPVLNYEISDSTLKSYSLFVNDEEQKLTESKGSVKLESVEEGENSIVISAVDRAENESEEEIIYYRDVTKPERGTVKVTPKTGFLNSSNKIPTIKWNGIDDDNLAEVQVKIDDGEYRTLGLAADGEAMLQSGDFTKEGKYRITVRGVDKAGNSSDEVTYNYYYETVDYELDDYTPVDVYATEQIGGNTILRFSTKNGKFRDDVNYQVYRSTTPNVVIGEKTFIKSYESKGSIKVSGNEGTTYYYKLRTVKKTNNGVQYSDYSEEISSTTMKSDIVEYRTGQNSMYQYSSVKTPNGVGAIELSRGNFLYSQGDISLPAPQLPVNIIRVYNSKNESKSSMGYGWRQSYDMYVSEKENTAYYIDGTEAVYTFTKSDDKYTCNETPDMSLEIDDDVLNRTITKTTTSQFGTDTKNTKDLEIDTYYKVTTKDGETYRFDECGRLLLIEETNGTFVYISYNAKDGHIKTVETSKGQVAEYSYNEQGLINRIVAASGTESEYSYSYEYENEYLVKAIFNGKGGKKIEYKYSYTDGKLAAITDAEGNQYKIEFEGRYVSRFIYPNGEFEKYSFTENQITTRPKTKVNKFNNGTKLNEEEFYFTLSGLIIEKTDAAGNKSSYSYDRNNKTLLTDMVDSQTYYALEGNTVVQKAVTTKENNKYDTYGNVIQSTDVDGSITEYTYDYNNKAAEVVKNQPVTMKTTDANGVVTANEAYEYDNFGNVVKEIDYITNVITLYSYGDAGEVTTSQELLGKDVNSQNFEETALMVSDENTTYTSDGDELTEELEEGTVEENSAYFYDEIGNVTLEVTSSTDIGEELLQKLSKKDIKVEEIKELIIGTDIVVMLYEYDDFLRTVKTIEISKKGITETENKYNNNGSILEEKDEKGRVTKYNYDSMNRAVKTELIVEGESKVSNITYSYGSLNRNNGQSLEVMNNVSIVTTTNKKGEIVGKTYSDALGRTVREMSNGLYTDYTYDKSGKVYTTYAGGIDESNPDLAVEGKLSVSTYDEVGNLTATIINPEIDGSSFKAGDDSIVTKNQYDESGNLKLTTDANGNITSYEYDEQGRILKVTTDGSVKGTYSYDNLKTGENGTYESVVETVTYANGAVAKTTTNGSDQIMSVKDETNDGNIETTYEYDKNGQLICETYSDGSCIRYEYDIDGNQTKKSTYNSSDNKAVISETDYTYDTEGNILKAIDSKSGTPYRYTYYEYDSYGRNTSIAEVNANSEPDVNTINASKLKYVYNVDDNIEKIYYPNNKSDKLKGIQFVYNKDKWITEIDGLFSNDETTVIRQYIYHNDGKVKTIKDYENFLNKGSDYIERDYTYDVFDRVTTMKYCNSTDVNTILEQYDYQYDKNSNITYEHEIFNYANNVKDEEIRYSYNSLNQLVKSEKIDNLTYKTTTSSYKYDSVGNRTYEGVFSFYTVDQTKSEITGNYTYSSYNALNQLKSATRIESEDGNNAKTYSYSYRYDEKGNQVEAIDGKAGTTTSYEYDVENQLTHVRIDKNGTKVSEEYNEYNGAGQRIKKRDIIVTDSGKEETNTTCYYYEGSLLLYTTDENGVKISQNIIGNQNNTFATIRYDGIKQSEYFYSKDVQGSVTNLADNTGMCSKSYNYTDFGETEERFESEVDNEICYTGGVYDDLTGLYYLNARYYNSDDGNFLSKDSYRGTEGNADSWNLYAYCAGNPVNYVDPSGHTSRPINSGQYYPAQAWNTLRQFETYKIKPSQLKKLGWAKSARKVSVVKKLNKSLKKYSMNYRLIICHFISQCMQESQKGKYPSEAGWIPKSSQKKYCSKYDYRNDLGNYKKGDGYKYRGVGYIQVTGKYNQSKFADAVKDQKIKTKGASYILKKKEYLWSISTYWWDMKRMNEKINSSTSVEDVTYLVNGGQYGLDNRKKYFKKCQKVFK